MFAYNGLNDQQSSYWEATDDDNEMMQLLLHIATRTPPPIIGIRATTTLSRAKPLYLRKLLHFWVKWNSFSPAR